MTRLAGHALRREGKVVVNQRGELTNDQNGGFGCALCECGATSPVLDSDAARKRWHRDHKTEMTKAAQA